MTVYLLLDELSGCFPVLTPAINSPLRLVRANLISSDLSCAPSSRLLQLFASFMCAANLHFYDWLDDQPDLPPGLDGPPISAEINPQCKDDYALSDAESCERISLIIAARDNLSNRFCGGDFVSAWSPLKPCTQE